MKGCKLREQAQKFRGAGTQQGASIANTKRDNVYACSSVSQNPQPTSYSQYKNGTATYCESQAPSAGKQSLAGNATPTVTKPNSTHVGRSTRDYAPPLEGISEQRESEAGCTNQSIGGSRPRGGLAC